MGLACYLAMTAAEFHANAPNVEAIAWMACYFSGSGNGLSNLPTSLPPDSLVILNDRFPLQAHDPYVIRNQLWHLAEKFSPKGFLLDLERPYTQDMAQLVQILVQEPPCPVCVSAVYAKGLDCPVFLPAPPLLMPLSRYLAPWAQRCVWLELAMQTQEIRIDSKGSQITDLSAMEPADPGFYDDACFCRYHWEKQGEQVVFQLSRQTEELILMEEAAKAMGVAQTVGLYQQLG